MAELICRMTDCSVAEAEQALAKHNGDITLAIDSILFPHTMVIKKIRVRADKTEEEAYVETLRTTLEGFDKQTDARSKCIPEYHSPSVSPCPPVEMVPQNNCWPEYLPTSEEATAQIPEMECPPLPGYSCDSP